MTDKKFDKWLKHAAKNSDSKIKDSKIFASIVSTDYMQDPLCALQLGLAILNDKPIILIVDHKVEIPQALVNIANRIERVDMGNAEGRQLIMYYWPMEMSALIGS